jgi:hypothetical protein
VETAVVVAIISAVASVIAAIFSAVLARRHQRQAREEERRSQAKVVLDRFRGPLLDAANSLGGRIDNIRRLSFFNYLQSDRKQAAKLTTLFRFANYFGWREVVRTEVQLLRFDNAEDTRLVAAFLGDITGILATDLIDGARAMLWNDEQRGIGELMMGEPDGAQSLVLGHAAFQSKYDEVFAPWMERFSEDLLTPQAVSGDRLRLLNWALFGLVRVLDEEGALAESYWIQNAAEEVRPSIETESATQTETRVKDHLTASGVMSTTRASR